MLDLVLGCMSKIRRLRCTFNLALPTFSSIIHPDKKAWPWHDPWWYRRRHWGVNLDGTSNPSCFFLLPGTWHATIRCYARGEPPVFVSAVTLLGTVLKRGHPSRHRLKAKSPGRPVDRDGKWKPDIILIKLTTPTLLPQHFYPNTFAPTPRALRGLVIRRRQILPRRKSTASRRCQISRRRKSKALARESNPQGKSGTRLPHRILGKHCPEKQIDFSKIFKNVEAAKKRRGPLKSLRGSILGRPPESSTP